MTPTRELKKATVWIPAERLDEFNDHIVGTIDVIHEFRK